MTDRTSKIASKKIAERLSHYLVVLQIVAFVLLTIAVLIFYVPLFLAYSDARFAGTQFWRLVAFLAPYSALLISIFVSRSFRKKQRYVHAIVFPVALIALSYFAGQFYLKKVPDPIRENFGRRETPYPGYLVLPADAVPSGFVEKEHYYSKSQYTISFTKTVDGKRIDLDISEGPRIQFGTKGCEETRTFDYRNVTGTTHACIHSKTGDKSLMLLWLNPPQQRVAIFLTHTPANDYSAEDLISILKSMK